MQNNSFKKTTSIILSSLLLSSLSSSAEPVTTMVVNTSYKLYKYEHPWQKSKRVKLNNKFLSRIVIGKCDVRQWCEYQGGYVKEFWLKDKVTIDTDEQEKINLESASVKAEPVTTMVVNTSYKLYKYEHPWQKSKRVKLNNKFLSRIVIGKCDVRQWCEYQGGYVKEFWLKDKVTIDTDEQEKINLESASVKAVETQTKRADKTSRKEETQTKIEEKKSKNEEVAVPAVVSPADALANTDKETILNTTEKSSTPKDQESSIREEQAPKKIESTQERVNEKEDTEVLTEDESQKHENSVVATKKTTEDDLFFGVQVSYTMMSVTQKDKVGTITLNKDPATSGYGLNAEIGYNYRPDIFVTAELSYQHYNDVNLYNTLLSINKKFIYKDIRPYLGLVGGLSTIQLTKQHTALPLNDIFGNQIAFGMQIGAEYMLKNELILVGEYQLLKAEHKTTISSYPSEIELIRDYYSIFSFGLRW